MDRAFGDTGAALVGQYNHIVAEVAYGSHRMENMRAFRWVANVVVAGDMHAVGTGFRFLA